jgi:hypothetical protein
LFEDRIDLVPLKTGNVPFHSGAQYSATAVGI